MNRIKLTMLLSIITISLFAKSSKDYKYLDNNYSLRIYIENDKKAENLNKAYLILVDKNKKNILDKQLICNDFGFWENSKNIGSSIVYADMDFDGQKDIIVNNSQPSGCLQTGSMYVFSIDKKTNKLKQKMFKDFDLIKGKKEYSNIFNSGTFETIELNPKSKTIKVFFRSCALPLVSYGFKEYDFAKGVIIFKKSIQRLTTITEEDNEKYKILTVENKNGKRKEVEKYINETELSKLNLEKR